MSRKNSVLAFSWLISMLGTAALTMHFTSSSAWMWETKPWIRRIKHWPEPVVALVGDTPIYQSDLQNYFNGLTPQLQDTERKMKASTAVLNRATYAFFWLDAAQSYNVFQSTNIAQRLDNEKSNILIPLVSEQIFSQDADPTETQITSFVDQNPSLFIKRIIHYREDLYNGSLSEKSSPRLIGSRHGSFTYPGTVNPPVLTQLVNRSPGQSTKLVPCNSNLCRYTKEGTDVTEPAYDAERIKQIAKSQIIEERETEWLATYQRTHPVKIKRQDLIDNLLR
jgi:hypothetical protein